MENTLPIDQVKKFVTGVVTMANVFGESFQDGKLDITDVTELLDVAKAVQILATVDYMQVMPQVMNIVPDEQKEIVDLISKELDLPQVEVQVKIQAILDQSKAVYEALFNLISTIQTVKRLAA